MKNKHVVQNPIWIWKLSTELTRATLQNSFLCLSFLDIANLLYYGVKVSMYQSIMTYSIITSGLISSTGEFRMIPAQQLQCTCTRKPDDRDKINHQEPNVTLEWLFDYILLRFNSRTRIFRFHRDITIDSKGRKMVVFAQCLRPLSREGCLSCHILL